MRGLGLHLQALRSSTLGMPGYVRIYHIPHSWGRQHPAVPSPAVLSSALWPQPPVGPAVPLLRGLAGKEASAAVPGSAFPPTVNN